MLTARDIQKVLAVLDRVERMTVAQAANPHFVGQLSADAFGASLPLKYVLGTFAVEVEKVEKKTAEAA